MVKLQALQIFLLITLGLADCFTTVIGVTFAGAAELNPLMAGIVNANMGAFLAVKIASTILIALSYFFASKILLQSPTKTSKLFKFSNVMLKVGYGSIIAFLCVVVVNNFAILLS